MSFINKSKTIRNDLSLIGRSISGGVDGSFYVEFVFFTFLQVFVSFLVHHKLGFMAYYFSFFLVNFISNFFLIKVFLESLGIIDFKNIWSNFFSLGFF